MVLNYLLSSLRHIVYWLHFCSGAEIIQAKPILYYNRCLNIILKTLKKHISYTLYIFIKHNILIVTNGHHCQSLQDQ